MLMFAREMSKKSFQVLHLLYVKVVLYQSCLKLFKINNLVLTRGYNKKLRFLEVSYSSV